MLFSGNQRGFGVENDGAKGSKRGYFRKTGLVSNNHHVRI